VAGSTPEGVDRVLADIEVAVFREIGDALEVSLAVFDSDLRLLFANKKFHSTHKAHDGGIALGESFPAIIRRVFSLLPEDRRETVLARMTAVMQNPDSTFREERSVENRYFRYRMVPLSGGRVLFSVQNITARRMHEAELEEKSRQFAAILEDQTEYISRLDTDLNVTFANSAYRRTFLVDPENDTVIGRNILSLIPDDAARENYLTNLRGLTPEDPIVHTELLERVADGSLQWQAWSDRALFDAEGRLTGYQSVGRDITERKIAEDALAANLREREAIVEGAIDAIVSIDGEGRVRDFNAAAQGLFGYALEEVQGWPVADLIIPPEHRAAHAAGLERYLADPASGRIIGRRIELEAISKSGARIPVELAVVDASSDEQTVFVAYLRDLRSAKQMEAELERQRLAVTQNEKMSALGSLLANVAHELNNPLSVVIGQSDLLRELSADEKTVARAERIKAAADRCARIVRTFLAMARQKPPEFDSFSARDAIGEAVDLVGYGLRSHGIELDVSTDDPLPPLHGDATQIGQILTNLLVNSQHALADTPAPRRIALTAAAEENGEVAIRIADNGPGVPAELRSRIFEPFFTTKQEGSGTGIGLAIAHNIAAAHGGSLRLLDSAHGAVFELRLPAGSEEPAAEAADESPAAVAGKRLLIVDDEESVAETVAEMLALAGYACEIAIGGEAALDRLLTEEFDGVLSDLRMPDLDGPALYFAACERRPGLNGRFGFFTGDSLGSNARRFLADESVPYVEKPFTRAALAELVERIAG